MMNKRAFTDIAKRIMQSNRGLQSPQIMHPEREWLTGVVIAVVIFVASAAWSAVMYMRYQYTEISTEVESAADVVVYREALVGAALEEFAARKIRHEALLAGGVMVIENISSQASSSTPVATTTESVITEPAREEATSTEPIQEETNAEEERIPEAEVVSEPFGDETNIVPGFQ